MIIETAFADSNGAALYKFTKLVDVARFKSVSIMRMNSRREPDKPRIRFRDALRCTSGAEDIPGAAARTDAHNGFGPAVPCAIDYLAAVAVERRVGDVRVTVDEPFDIPAFLGHFRSIQRSTGPAM